MPDSRWTFDPDHLAQVLGRWVRRARKSTAPAAAPQARVKLAR